MRHSPTKTLLYTVLALIAFAGNSVLCRLALRDESIDAGSFTIIRLLSGAGILMLALMFTKAKPGAESSKGSWWGALTLWVYAVGFSYAYISLDTGTGALVLFGMVQITMIFVSLASGTRLQAGEWLGLILAFAGFTYLVLPNIASPSLAGFILMALAGIAWGAYTLIGRQSQNPLADTAYNFTRSLPLIALLAIYAWADADLSYRGVLLAALSGAVTSGLGYAIWYLALGGLSAIQASVAQLLVPVIAALGGLIFTNEDITLRLMIATAVILGGVLCVVLSRALIAKRSDS